MLKKGKKTVLVTGGTGLIGSHLIYDLLISGYYVRAFKRKTGNTDLVRKVFSCYSPNPDGLMGKIEWIEADILKPESMANGFTGVDYVFHAAGMVTFDTSKVESMFKVNIRGTEHVIQLCIRNKVKGLCHLSSVSAISRRPGISEARIDESKPWDLEPETPYAISKYRSEELVWKAIAGGLHALIVNPGIVIGPGDWSRSSSKMFLTSWNGLPFYSQGLNAFVDVRDVSRCMVELVEQDAWGERFILVGENLYFRDVFNQMADHLSKRRPWIKFRPWMGELGIMINSLWSKISGEEPVITRTAINSANKITHYLNDKIVERLDYSFIPISKSIADTSVHFLREFRMK